MSNSVRPHRQQPTRLPHPWDSPGKNTGVSCHFILQCMKVKSESEVAQLCLTLRDPMDCSLPGSSIHGIFQAGVLEWSAIIVTATAKSLHSCPTLRDPIDSSPPGSPIPGILQARTLEWVAIAFSIISWLEGKKNIGGFSKTQLLFPSQTPNPELLHTQWRQLKCYEIIQMTQVQIQSHSSLKRIH